VQGDSNMTSGKYQYDIVDSGGFYIMRIHSAFDTSLDYEEYAKKHIVPLLTVIALTHRNNGRVYWSPV